MSRVVKRNKISDITARLPNNATTSAQGPGAQNVEEL